MKHALVAFRIMIFCCPVLRGSQQPLVYPNLCVSKRSSSCVFTYSVHQSESRFYSSHSCVDTPKIVHSCVQYNSLAQSRLPVSWFAKSIWLVWLSSFMIFQAVVCLWVVSTGRCALGRRAKLQPFVWASLLNYTNGGGVSDRDGSETVLNIMG